MCRSVFDGISSVGLLVIRAEGGLRELVLERPSDRRKGRGDGADWNAIVERTTHYGVELRIVEQAVRLIVPVRCLERGHCRLPFVRWSGTIPAIRDHRDMRTRAERCRDERHKSKRATVDFKPGHEGSKQASTS